MQVPTYDVPDVQPENPGAAVANYGAGPGSALQAAGGEAFKDALAVKDQQDGIVAQQAYLKAVQATTDGLYGEGGIATRQGVDAFGMTQRAGAFLTKTAQDAAGELTTPAQQRMFNNLFDRYTVGRTDALAQHELAIRQQTRLETGVAVADTQANVAAQHPDNAAMVANAADTAERAIRGAFAGQPDEFVADKVGKARSDVFERAVQSRLATDPTAAQGLYHDYASQLDAAATIRVQEQLRPAISRAQDQAFRASLVGATPAYGSAPASAPGGPVDVDAVSGAIVRAESGGDPTAQNTRSTAGGAGQFLDSTWLSMLKASFPDVAAGKSNAELVALKTDPGQGQLQRAVTTAYTRQNASSLAQAGLPVTPATLYLAHGFGAGGAAALLGADPSTPVEKAVTPAVMAANPQLAGKTVGGVMQTFADKVGGSVPDSAAKVQRVAPDLDAMEQRAVAAAAGDPEREQRNLSIARQVFAQWEAQTRVQHAALMRSIPDVQASLEAGNDAPAPEAQIRALLPKPQADEVMSELALSRQAGSILKPLESASPAERAEAIADLRSGQGVRSAMLRVAARTATGGRTLAGPGADGAADAGGPGPDDTSSFRLREKLADRVEQIDERNNRALTADPAAYAATLPAVQPLLARAQQSQDPKDMQAAIDASVALQQHMGVSDPRVLSNGQADGLVRSITSLDPATASVGPRLDALEAQYGDRWPQVFGELVAHKLPDQYRLMAAIDNPIGRDDAQRAFALLAKKGGVAEMAKSLSPDASAAIFNKQQSTLESSLDAFKQTTTDPALVDGVRTGVRTLATYYASTQAMDGAAAIKAATGVILGRYDFDDTLRVPKGTLSDVKEAIAHVAGQLRPQDLEPWQSHAPGLTTDDDRAKAKVAANRGFWVPNKDESGLELRSPLFDPSGLGLQASAPVRYATGEPVSVRFADVPKLAAAGRAARGANLTIPDSTKGLD